MVRELRPQERDPSAIYNLCKAHDMAPQHVDLALATMRSLASAPEAYVIEQDGTEVVTLFFTDILDGESCYVGAVLRPKLYANGDREEVESMVSQVIRDVAARHDVRRVTTTVPVLRSRTKRLLRGAGFQIEGRMRRAWRAMNREPEDVYVMGFIPGEAQ